MVYDPKRQYNPRQPFITAELQRVRGSKPAAVRTDRANAAGGATGARPPATIPPELQQFFQQQREQATARSARQREAEQRNLRKQLAGTGLAGSGIAQEGAQSISQQSRLAEEEALKDIAGQEQIARFQFGEAERGRGFQREERLGTQEFEAEQNARNRALQQQALDLQQRLGLGYYGPDGQWVRGSAEIANIELDESLRNDMVNAMQALKDLKNKHYDRMMPYLMGIYGAERTGALINAAELNQLFEQFSI